MAARSVDLVARLIADSSKFKQGMAEATLSAKQGDQMLRSMGRNMETVGKNMTRSITLPFAAVGVAAVKTFTDFDTELNKIGTQVLGSTEGLDKLGESIRGIAVASGQGPDVLAKAMFSIESNGLRGADAMDALDISAKAAAVGLGEAQDVAKFGASAFVAYESTGLKASEAVDVLTATVREGNLSAEELAGSIGQVLPVASNASVELSEVGAAIALLTRNGAGASEAVTQVRAAITQLNAPTAEAADLLAQAGISTEKMRSVLADQGLVAAFELLNKKFGDSPEQLRKVVGSSEALNAVLSITSMNAAEVDRVFQATADSAGVTEKAFDQVSETAGFKFQQAIALGKDALIDIGDELAPLAVNAASTGAELVHMFSDLPQPAKNAVVALGGVAAAAGPLLTLAGKLTGSWGSFKDTMGKISPATLGVGAGLGILTAVLFDHAQKQAEAAARAQEFTDAIVSQGEAVGEMSSMVAAQAILSGELGEKLRTAGADVGEFVSAIQTSGDAIDRLADSEILWNHATFDLSDALADAGLTGTKLGDELTRVAEEADLSNNDIISLIYTLREQAEAFSTGTREAENIAAAEKAAADASRDLEGEGMGTVAMLDDFGKFAHAAADESRGHADAMDAERTSLVELGDALQAQFDPLFGMLDALQSNKDATAAVTAAQDELNRVRRRHAEGSVKVIEAERALTDAQNESAKSALGVNSAQLELEKAVRSGAVSIEDGRAQLLAWVQQGLIGADTAAALSDQFAYAAGSAKGARDNVANLAAEVERTNGKHADVAVTANTGDAAARIAAVKAGLDAIPSSKTITITVVEAGQALGSDKQYMPQDLGEQTGRKYEAAIGKGMLAAAPQAERDAREAAQKLIDAALSQLSRAQGAVSAAWDKIMGRFARQDAQQAVREAERALAKAQSGSGVDAARREGARTVAGEQRDVAQAKRALAGIDAAFNPDAAREARRTLHQEQRDVARARAAARRDVRHARVEAKRDRRDARAALEDANLGLLQESEWMIGAGMGGRFRNIAEAAGLRGPEIRSLIASLRAQERAEDRVSSAKQGKVELGDESVKKLAHAIAGLHLTVDVDDVSKHQRKRERASR